MKRILIVAAVAVLIPAAAFAGVFGLSLGLNAGLAPDLGTIIEAGKAKNLDILKEMDTYQFGPELRLRLWFLELDVNALFQPNGLKNGEAYEKVDYQIYGNLGVSFNLFKILGIGLGLGTDMFYSPVGPSGGVPIIGYGTATDPERQALMAELGGVDLKNLALTAPLNVRANIDLNFGRFTFGVEGVLPTNLCAVALSDPEVWKKAYEGALADWGHTKVSIFLGYSLL